MSTDAHTDDHLDQPIWGVDEIAAVIGRTRRQTYHLLQEGHIPARKIGAMWTTTRRRLRAHFAGESA